MTRISIGLARTAALAGAVLLFGCGESGTTDAPAAGGDAPAPAAAAAKPELSDATTKIDFKAANARGKTAMFVPAPTEFQAALSAASAEIDITKLAVGSTRSLEGKSKPIAALETGVRVADLLLTAQTGDKAATLARIKSAREGLAALGGGAEMLKQVDEVTADLESGVLAIDKIGPVLDVLALDIEQDLEKSVGKDIATMVEAGGWVEAVHLLSGALAAGEHNADAAALMNQPSVLEHFMGFLRSSAPAQAKAPDVLAVIAEMEKMGALGGKDLTAEDVKALNGHTAAILAKF